MILAGESHAPVSKVRTGKAAHVAARNGCMILLNPIPGECSRLVETDSFSGLMSTSLRSRQTTEVKYAVRSSSHIHGLRVIRPSERNFMEGGACGHPGGIETLSIDTKLTVTVGDLRHLWNLDFEGDCRELASPKIAKGFPPRS